jgi:predicted ATPase/DNA-binding winged helix-turn-helix (wHTH) protein
MQNPLVFGRVVVLPSQRQVTVDGQPVVLGARAFDLLLALIERRHRLATKRELLQVVWPGLVVEVNNLAVQVAALRRVLGPNVVATVPGRGYRFVAFDESGSDGDGQLAPTPMPMHALSEPVPTLPGRELDLRSLQALIGEHRLVTLIGAGGAGKTRLAHQAATLAGPMFPHGVHWCDCADLPGIAAVARMIGTTAASMPGDQGRMLLVLDGVEHLVDALAPLVREALANTASPHLLLTSQAPLRILGEHIMRLPALSLPPFGAGAAEARGHGSMAMLVERASALDRHFVLSGENLAPLIALCHRLDGLPLAIEMAAARLPVLGAAGLVASLEQGFSSLKATWRGTPARHATLRATVERSCSLLSSTERAALDQLCVLPDGFGVVAARDAVAELGLEPWEAEDVLCALVDRSLVAVVPGDVADQFRLPPAVRAFALESRATEGGPTSPLTRCA